VPWLGPDICDQLADLADGGAPAVVVVPVGFVSDHVEVLYDLDIEAAQAAKRLGLPMARAATPGTDPCFVSMITELVAERRSKPASGFPDLCPNDCCRVPAARPAAPPGAGR
jgi:ferrochelatase